MKTHFQKIDIQHEERETIYAEMELLSGVLESRLGRSPERKYEGHIVAIAQNYNVIVRSFPWNNWLPLFVAIPKDCPPDWGYVGKNFADSRLKIINAGTASACVPINWECI